MWTVVPLVPVMVMVDVPVLAVLATLKVSFDVPEPVMDVGLYVPVTPVGSPDEVSLTAESNPPVAVTVTVTYPLCPSSREPEAGETDTLNPAVTGAVTVSVKVVVWVRVGLVPVTVMV